jgi:hypothetical protein
VFRHACEIGVEGIVSKRSDAPYGSGRLEAWNQAQVHQERNLPDRRLCGKAGRHARARSHRSMSAAATASVRSTPARRALGTPRRYRELREQLALA